jgi:hypothetical protein
MLNVANKPLMLSVFMLNVFMLNAIMLSVVMLNAVAPYLSIKGLGFISLTFVQARFNKLGEKFC